MSYPGTLIRLSDWERHVQEDYDVKPIASHYFEGSDRIYRAELYGDGPQEYMTEPTDNTDNILQHFVPR